jgi:D-amino peptidase
MKILIACDMEGITGVTRWEHVSSKHAEYGRYRSLMTADVNAAIEGALAGGADEIEVADGHSSGHNLLIEELNSNCRLNAGNSSPWSMMNGIDSSFDGVIFVGYHAMAGTADAILAHTWDEEVLTWCVNGEPFGEFALNASIAGYCGVPAVMVTGDQAIAAEAQTFIPGIETVIVKEASGYFSASCLPPEKTRELIYAGAKKAVENIKNGKAPKPFKINGKVSVALTFNMPHYAESASRLPGSVRTDGKTVQIEAKNVIEAFYYGRLFTKLAS